MGIHYTQHFQTRVTPQSRPIPGTGQVANSEGGYAWAVDDWTRLDRFLILGTEGGSYYASEQALTIENAEAVRRCLVADGVRAVQRVVEISTAARAPKNDPALFALAMAASLGPAETKQAALAALPQVARTGTHLFTFVEYVQGFRGWGRGLRRAVGAWYGAQPAVQLAYQLVKYRQRNGWSHRDVLRLAHPRPSTPAHHALYRWVAAGGEMGARVVKRQTGAEQAYDAVPREQLPALVAAFEAVQQAATVREVVRHIAATPQLSWEMIPSRFLGKAKVWEALLPQLPLTALLRNLARMTANGLLVPGSAAARVVAERLADGTHLRAARIHPIAVLGALVTYRRGRAARGQLSWEPAADVVDALDQAFYLSFGNVFPTGTRWLLALDVSGSMGRGSVAGVLGLTPRVASAAMAMVTARVERQCTITAFSHEMVPVSLSPRQRLDDVVDALSRIPMGGTDCALPMRWALAAGVKVDTVVVYTDSETWYGSIHPAQALRAYRQATGIPAKLVVVGMVANAFSIADPADPGMLDVVGFDTASPQLISDFALW
jgi:60 kDa SS-A/Ro ribonucleoprotein